MRNFLRSLPARIGRALVPFVAGLGIGSFLIGPAALALVIPGQFAPRQFPTQQVHYERHVVSIAAGSAANSSTGTADGLVACIMAASSTSTTCSVRVGAVGYNAFLLRATLQVLTGCNTGGTGPACTVALGTASGGAQIIAATSVITTGTSNPALANAGILATGNNITASGANGGFDIWLTLAQSATTMTEATAGTFVIVLEFLGANDGGCITNVPMASTAGPC